MTRCAWPVVLVALAALAACSSASSKGDGGSGDGGNPCAVPGATGQACTLAGNGGGVCCSGVCANLQTSAGDCGGCGQVCPALAACAGGRCVNPDSGVPITCADGGCPADTACCNDACVDLDDSNANCGKCGQACDAGSVCLEGHCRLTEACPGDGGPCALGQGAGVCCGSSCTDTTVDTSNCGQCGAPCPAGESCLGGVCFAADGGVRGCEPGPVLACPSGFDCTAVGSSGLCLSPSCAGKEDDLQCAAGGGAGLCCGGQCLNTATDADDCGTCGKSCPQGQLCHAGACQTAAACAAGATSGLCQINRQTNGTCCGATCAETASDPANCGGCGNACQTGEICVGGECLDAACNGASAGAACAIDGGAGIGECCGTRCADVAADPQNCGSCGAACSPDQICSGFQDGCLTISCADAGAASVRCITNPVGGVPGLCCAGTCIASTDLEGDTSHCGGCDPCPAGSAFTCLEGTCTTSDCAQATQANTRCLSGSTAGLCCRGACATAQLETDAQNCGECGAVCPVEGVCQSGSCVNTDGGIDWCAFGNACPAGTGCANTTCASEDCSTQLDGQPCYAPLTELAGLCCGHVCIDPQNNPENCGKCGFSCGPRACSNGACL